MHVYKVTGEAKYPGDIDLPGQLWMKVMFANRPHARITKLDTTQAVQAPGVVAILTAKDVPVNEYGLNVFDNPVLCGPDAHSDTEHFSRGTADYRALDWRQTCGHCAETERQADHAREFDRGRIRRPARRL